jgi:hypothetical protein
MFYFNSKEEKMFNKINKSKNKRFKTIYDEGAVQPRCKIIVDTETGVNYLINVDGFAGGITALLDKNGKPIVSQV